MARIAQTDRAGCDARCGASRSHPVCRGGGQLGAVAPFFALEISPIDVRTAGEIERGVAAFAHQSNGGLIVLSSFLAAINRHTIIAMAAHHRLPAIYPTRFFVDDGGLISYASELIDHTAGLPVMSTAFSGARNQPTSRCRRPPSTGLSSTQRLPRSSALPCHRHCSLWPMT